uniref:Uncharacterized protein n=1 Tax=Arundo donax TaxID=35708 RepID=A0A0A8Z022_ARUDO
MLFFYLYSKLFILIKWNTNMLFITWCSYLVLRLENYNSCSKFYA